MKGVGLLFHIFLFLIIATVSMSQMYGLVSFSQGALQRVEILTQNMATELGSQPALVVPKKMHVLITDCSDIVLPDEELFGYADILEEINSECSTQLGIICSIYEYHKGDFYMACRGLTLNPDKTYYYAPSEDPRTILIEDVGDFSVKLN
ncbi:MAG: hypothetical protein GOV00_04470 [Candidatus Altiarchaeota archaeon]|nr:hypothetical protein [Candidatus Altiarchaeota archaeon]